MRIGSPGPGRSEPNTGALWRNKQRAATHKLTIQRPPEQTLICGFCFTPFFCLLFAAHSAPSVVTPDDLMITWLCKWCTLVWTLSQLLYNRSDRPPSLAGRACVRRATHEFVV